MKNIIILVCTIISQSINASEVLDLDAAIRSENVNAVAALLDAGVDPSSVIDEGENAIWKHSPLILAVKSHNVEMVRLLIERGADVNYANTGSATALKIAAKNNHDEIASLLIDAKADVNFIDEDEVPILFWAVSHKSKKVIPLLLKAGADPDKEFNSMFHGRHTVRRYFSQDGKSDPSVLELLD